MVQQPLGLGADGPGGEAVIDADRYRAALEMIEELHVPVDAWRGLLWTRVVECGECRQEWPCRTFLALAGVVRPEGVRP